MPIHDWTLVEAGIFHAFHHHWVSAISDMLNAGLLARDHYALPDVSIMHDQAVPRGDEIGTRFTAESDEEFYRKRKSSVVETYQAAFDDFPQRWRNVLEPPSSPT